MNKLMFLDNRSESLLFPLLFIPLHTILEFDARASENIQSTADGQVNLAVAELLHKFEIFD